MPCSWVDCHVLFPHTSKLSSVVNEDVAHVQSQGHFAESLAREVVVLLVPFHVISSMQLV